ncbi:MAG: CDP-diacylglycerol--glycerol-3-phosphate 3-phosphatidyltransferase [Thiotrichales bacterium]
MTTNIPNLLTLLRIVMIPLIVVVYYLPWAHAGIVAAILFALAGITDWFDGYLARRLNQTSTFGAFLDPVADKLMVAAILVMVVDHHGGIWLTLAAIIIIGREITVSALREWMSEVGQRHKVAVSSIGKIKTTAQMVSLFFLLYYEPLLGLPSYQIGFVLLSIAAVLTLWSMIEYLKAAWDEM